MKDVRYEEMHHHVNITMQTCAPTCRTHKVIQSTQQIPNLAQSTCHLDRILFTLIDMVK